MKTLHGPVPHVKSAYVSSIEAYSSTRCYDPLRNIRQHNITFKEFNATVTG